MAAYNYPWAATPSYYQPQVPRQEPLLKGRLVSSFEEARASMIDFDGTVFYFPDLANQKIYTKQINLDGTPLLKVYELVAVPQPQTADGSSKEDLVTRKEFEEAINNILSQIPKDKEASSVEASPQYNF